MVILGAGTVRAGTARTTFLVAASVIPQCTIVASDLSFGRYDPLRANAGASLDAAASVLVTCTRGTKGRVVLDAGAHGAGDGTRQMAMGGERLVYQLYKDAPRSAVWWPRDEGEPVLGAGLSRGPQRITVFARIFAGQVVLAGTYSDTLRATVEF